MHACTYLVRTSVYIYTHTHTHIYMHEVRFICGRLSAFTFADMFVACRRLIVNSFSSPHFGWGKDQAAATIVYADHGAGYAKWQHPAGGAGQG